MTVKITARSHSADPAQEALRNRKQEWNKACSEFIARLNAFKPHLISFKRGLNGRGDLKAGIPVSNIKDPLPGVLQNYLGSVSSEFNELASIFANLVSEANGIAGEQATYSSKRRKSTKTHLRPTVAMVDNNQLVVEGSNALTRFWANLSSILSSDVAKQQRLSMLSLASNLFENLVNLEDEVLSKGLDNIPKILNMYFLISNNLTALNFSLQKLNELKNPQILNKPTVSPAAGTNNNTDPPKNKPQASSAQENTSFNVDDDTPLNKLYSNVNLMLSSNVGMTMKDVSKFIAMYNVRENEKNENKKDTMEDRLRIVYEELLDVFKKHIADTFDVEPPTNITLNYISDLKKQAYIEDDLTKYSSNYLSRLYKEYSHYIGKKDPSTAPRLEIFNTIRTAKEQVDDVMDILERKNLSIKELSDMITKIDESIISMSNPIKLLNILYKNKYFADAKNYKNLTIDPVERYFTKQIRKDVDKPGW